MATFLLLLALQDDYDSLLQRLRRDNPGEAAKVEQLPRETALKFLRHRFSGREPSPKTPEQAGPSPARLERFAKIETLVVGDFAIDLCRRDDGAFGLGEIRRGDRRLRRSDFLIVWTIDGKVPSFAGRRGQGVSLRDPEATLTFAPETRASAGTVLSGFRIDVKTTRGPIVETASWEPGGSTRGLTFQDGYRGWHAPPGWLPADAVPETNPKLSPGLLNGTGFQFLHGPDGALATFHASPGDRLKNVSRGEALEFETTWAGPAAVSRFVFTAGGDRRINLWTRAFEVAHAEIRRSLDLPTRGREVICGWPPFARRGFRETATQCLRRTVEDGFTAVAIDALWDNFEAHGGAKNMNVWDYAVCEAYGGKAGLKELVEQCHGNGLKVIAWTPAGHLANNSPVFKAHPEWLAGHTPSTPKEGIGPVYGSLHTAFHDFYRRGILGAIREFKLDGLWLDSHLPYPAMPRENPHAAKLAALYGEFARAGATHLLMEGDASAIGSYGIGIDERWGKVPEPELLYNAELLGWPQTPRFFRDHFRTHVALGATWIVPWDVIHDSKLSGSEWDAARQEILEVVREYRKVKDLMVHRFITEDGVVWTNDRDTAKVVWLFRDARLPDGAPGRAGSVTIVQ